MSGQAARAADADAPRIELQERRAACRTRRGGWSSDREAEREMTEQQGTPGLVEKVRELMS